MSLKWFMLYGMDSRAAEIRLGNMVEALVHRVAHNMPMTAVDVDIQSTGRKTNVNIEYSSTCKSWYLLDPFKNESLRV